MPSRVLLYGIFPRRTSLKAVETGLLGFTRSLSGGAPLLSCLARLVTTLTRVNFESTCSKRPSRSPKTESLMVLCVFQFFDTVVRQAMDAEPLGPNDRFEIVDRDFGMGLFVDDEIVEAANEGQFHVRDL